MKSSKALWAIGVLTPLAALAAWWFGSANSTNPFFPPLQQILIRFQELWLFAHFSSDVMLSLRNLTLGFTLGVAAGLVIGFVLAMVPLIRWMFEPVIHFFRGIPAVALVPILITLIGFGVEMRVANIALAAFFPTLIATMDGIRSVDGGLKDVCQVYRLTTAERITRVYLPSASPQIASGMQVSLQVAFIVMIASEMLGSSQGIGALTLLAQQSFMSADMWAGILLLGLIGFMANMVFELVKRRVLAWYIGLRAQERAA
ncbi:ABC transporter permease [Paeniglutamicibacter cryotolerans]|uniref:ABC-type nitrate/sulfonate/bicarbonate transport system permease component n=1 Tax=Paeniglutamicibacter cryotolerans TaxID=670079 RepID=A0A839QE71_9MICC|nr:ABC transporter permease [Paeniglutamicibacter cryotolerans]MBB2994449.1 ABC-type nitrate/sulfonate/bicarbonate transport system permease component [Paeniglutamicibacter cryotolerans]